MNISAGKMDAIKNGDRMLDAAVHYDAVSMVAKLKDVVVLDPVTCALLSIPDQVPEWKQSSVPPENHICWVVVPLKAEQHAEVFALDIRNKIMYNILHFSIFHHRLFGELYGKLPSSLYGMITRDRVGPIQLGFFSDSTLIPSFRSLFHFPAKIMRLLGINQNGSEFEADCWKLQHVLYFGDGECGLRSIDQVFQLVLNPDVNCFEDLKVRYQEDMQAVRDMLVSSFIKGFVSTMEYAAPIPEDGALINILNCTM